MSPTIAENDLRMKVRTAGKFIEKGHRVKLTVQVAVPDILPLKGFPRVYTLETLLHFVIMWRR